jgi:spore germination protein KB
MMSIATFIMASSLLTKTLYSYTKNDAWAAVLFGYLLGMVIVSIYAALAKKHPGCTLIEINEAVFGRIPGKAISMLYVFYFYTLAGLNTRDLGDFINGMLLPNSPPAIIYTIFVALCAFAVKKGAVNLTRYGMLFAVMTIVAILGNSSLLLNIVKPENLRPVMTLPLKNYLIGTHIVAMFPMCEVITFMMMLPYMQKPGEFGKAMKGGLLIGTATMLIIVFRDIMVMGGYIKYLPMPTFSVIRLIDIGDILTRLETVYSAILVSFLFFKVCIIYYALVTGIERLFQFDSYKFMVRIVGALIIVFAAGLIGSLVDHARWNLKAAPVYSTFFLFVLPLATLITSGIRGMMDRKGSAVSENGMV